MRQLSFFKYQGSGNDFVMIDNRNAVFDCSAEETVRHLCERRFGVGADGLILLQDHPGYDFEMIYFNADGREGSMCGNGGRCAAAFARQLGIIDRQTRFLAVDGPHEARINEGGNWVELRMGKVARVEKGGDYFYLDTGSPHYVVFVDDLAQVDVVAQGRAVRYSDRFRESGTNVNFVQPTARGISVATYERGVEDETLSCGTGVTAAAIAYYLREPAAHRQRIDIRAKGGELQVHFEPAGEGFDEIWLCGPAERVFSGRWMLEA